MSIPRKHKDTCCICGNRRPDYTLHSFPTVTYRDIYDKWIAAIGRKDLAELPVDVVRKKYKVCEAHFGRNDYYIAHGMRKLKKNSIPIVDCKKVDSPCTPRKDRCPSGIACTPQTVKYFAKSVEEKLLAEYNARKAKMEEAQHNSITGDINEAPCFIKMEVTEDAQDVQITEEMEEASCITSAKEMEEAQYLIKKEDTDKSQSDPGMSWGNGEDAVLIEVIPDIFEYR